MAQERNSKVEECMKRKAYCQDSEPEQKKFDLPSEKEHLFQVVDVFTIEDEIGKKLGLDENTVSVKCEVVDGDEEGRTLLQRLSLDDKWRGFFATRLFLKAISLPHKGDIEIDTDEFIGKQFYAIVFHNNGFANIKSYNFNKIVEQVKIERAEPLKTDAEVEWDA